MNSFAFLPLLQAEAQGQPSLLGALLPFLLIIVVMYFLMIRPQQKRQKAHNAMLSALKSGDEVVTVGGVLVKTKLLMSSRSDR